MFGLVVAGRLVQTDVNQISETEFLFNIPDADNINHVVIFMTGQAPFPQELGGAVYFSWPSPEGSSWLLLGHITNSKPSAIFKISKLKPADSKLQQNLFGQQPSHLAQIGISVEPLSQLAQQTPTTLAATSTLEPFLEFSQKMLENFVNYCSSFTINQSQMAPNPTETYIPLSTLQTWFQNFQRRLQQNPYFWRS
ncbi:protein OPI10 homolog [Gigantopelta aegis]|uniref:protein OPI10 homolog n=1 Tax=Gigantopelta aegis TaxID=1735272 RepID=UPI001B888710|nr:protein OPI10 homolog [Gigantopelta aegis]